MAKCRYALIHAQSSLPNQSIRHFAFSLACSGSSVLLLFGFEEHCRQRGQPLFLGGLGDFFQACPAVDQARRLARWWQFLTEFLQTIGHRPGDASRGFQRRAGLVTPLLASLEQGAGQGMVEQCGDESRESSADVADSGAEVRSGNMRMTAYTPADTIVAAWIMALTGVGPSMASGSQT